MKQVLNDTQAKFSGKGLSKLLKMLAAVGLSAALMFGAAFGMSSCAPDAPHSADTPTVPSSDPVQKEDDVHKDPDEADDGSEETPDDSTGGETGDDSEETPDETGGEKDDSEKNPDETGGSGEDSEDEPKPEFTLNDESIKVIKENLQTVADVMCSKKLGYKEPEIVKAYLCRENSTYFNTIGCVMITNEGIGFLHSKMTFNGLNEDLTWENIYKNSIKTEIDEKNYKVTNEFSSSSKTSGIKNFDKRYIPAAFKKAFDLEEYAPIWTGWSYQEGPLGVDHYLTLIYDNTIYERMYEVDNNGNGIFNSFVTNFIEASDDTHWKKFKDTESLLIPEEYLAYLVDFTATGAESA